MVGVVRVRAWLKPPQCPRAIVVFVTRSLRPVAREFRSSGAAPAAAVPQIFDEQAQVLVCRILPAERAKSAARVLGGRGIDRVVPFGSALSFSAVWDCYELLSDL